MKIRIILSVLALVSAIQSQQTNSQTTEQDHSAMMKRGDAGMGFSQDKTTHHFLLRKTGGVIQVSTNDPKDEASKDHIRMHLSHAASMFSEGDFNIPMFIHDTTPPGVPTMERLQKEIRYHYEQTDAGAKIVIATTSPEALKAVHEFLRFQISEHRTRDRTQVTNDATEKVDKRD